MAPLVGGRLEARLQAVEAGAVEVADERESAGRGRDVIGLALVLRPVADVDRVAEAFEDALDVSMR